MAKFNIRVNEKGEFYFDLVARNGKAIATSAEPCMTRQACYKSITSVQRNAPIADIIERGREHMKGIMCCMECEWVGHITKAFKVDGADEYRCPSCDGLCVPQDIGDEEEIPA